MKYKRIDSALHNFGHSFTSLVNYVDDAYVIDELAARIRREPHVVTINFSTGEVFPTDARTDRLRKSIEYWKADLGRQLASQQTDLQRLRDVILSYRLTPKGPETVIEAVDDRGVRHSIPVQTTA